MAGRTTNKFFQRTSGDPATFRADRTFFGKFNLKALGIMAIVLRVEKNRKKHKDIHCIV